MLVISLVVTACGGKSGKKAGHDSKEGDVAVESTVDVGNGKVTIDLGGAQLRWDNLGDAELSAEEFERFNGDVVVTAYYETNNYTEDTTHEIGLRLNWDDKSLGDNRKVKEGKDSISFDVSDEQRKSIINEGFVYLYGHNVLVDKVEIDGEIIEETESSEPLFTEENGLLHVSDGKLVNEAGNPIQLKGLANFYLSVQPQLARKSVFKRMKDEWGANVLRLPVNVDTSFWGAPEKGYASGSDEDRAKITATLDKAIAAARETGMYAIVEWVVLEEKNPLAEIEYAKQFFEYVSST